MSDYKRDRIRIVYSIIAACLVFGIIGGFRTDIPIITGLVSTAGVGISYGEISLAYSTYKIVSAVSSLVVAVLAMKKSGRFLLLLGIILTIFGVFVMAVSTSLIGFIIGLGVLLGFGTSALSFGIVFGILSPLLKEKVAIVISSVLTLSSLLFGVVFSPFMQTLFDTFGYIPMMMIMNLLILCTIPFAFILGSKKNEAGVQKEKKSIRIFSTIKSLATCKEFYILILLFFMTGFIPGFVNHFYIGALTSSGYEGSVVALLCSSMEIIAAAAGILLAFFIPKIKRGFTAAAIVLLTLGALDLVLFFAPRENSIIFGVISLLIITFAMVYPLQKLLIIRKFSPVLVASLLCFLTMFDKLGSAINSALGGFIYDATGGSFTLLSLMEGILGLIAGAIILIFALRGGDKNTEQIKPKSMDNQ